MGKSIDHLVEVVSRPDSVKRATAVAAALEVIALSVSHSTDANQLTHAMGNLSAYADEIQKALGDKQ
ncbi:hypothetical protein SAMN05216248_101700 [Pseudomonas simiae]|uniref:hypothetical protein n=1 Tax=Pseudomonas simiae TaxID=321846 RepID=UPI00084D2E2F|nr:hypothetical protein [Pseudomonas simiae]SFA83127.1 hypothetical protein SAMN05216248_101700 [Pseudomonas simiae]